MHRPEPRGPGPGMVWLRLHPDAGLLPQDGEAVLLAELF